MTSLSLSKVTVLRMMMLNEGAGLRLHKANRF